MDTTSYSFSYPKEAWDAWRDTIPKGKNIDAHLQELIAEDTIDRTHGSLNGRAEQQLELILDELEEPDEPNTR